MVTYFNTQTEVLVGDYVEVKVWLEFWRGWQPGRVWYVPGISPLNCELEHHGLTWGGIHYAKGKQFGVLVEPSTRQLRKTARFVRRTDDELTRTPDDYYWGDEERYCAIEIQQGQDSH